MARPKKIIETVEEVKSAEVTESAEAPAKKPRAPRKPKVVPEPEPEPVSEPEVAQPEKKTVKPKTPRKPKTSALNSPELKALIEEKVAEVEKKYSTVDPVEFNDVEVTAAEPSTSVEKLLNNFKPEKEESKSSNIVLGLIIVIVLGVAYLSGAFLHGEWPFEKDVNVTEQPALGESNDSSK